MSPESDVKLDEALKNPISLLSWVYNEEPNIGEWIAQIRPYVKEIIVIDCESTDGTPTVIRECFPEVKLYILPHLVCGDQYRLQLVQMATQPWILWSYPDERWPEKTLKVFEKLVQSNQYNAFSFMRHEYLDDERVRFGLPNNEEGFGFHGTDKFPNYQTRLFKRGEGIWWSDLVHAEYHGPARVCPMPPEYYMEHRKTRKDQEFDNIRTYLWLKYLIWKYGDTTLEPFKTFIDSYKRIERETLASRPELPAEAEWWKWREHMKLPGFTRAEGT